MPSKLIRMQRGADLSRGPVVLAVAGDSASGKTMLARQLVEALGEDRCTWICTDDYHRYDRADLARMPFTVLDPRANHVEIMEQHLQLLALGRPVLKPVYDHASGRLVRPELVEPREFLVVEGLLPLSTRMARACFDVMVYLEPDESLRRAWKVRRDTTERGYTPAQALAELERRRPDAEAYVRPQRREADIVVKFAPECPDDRGLSVDLLLRPTVRHPHLADRVVADRRAGISLTIVREEGTPTDLLHVRSDAPPEDVRQVAKEIWSTLDQPDDVPTDPAGEPGATAPLALTRLVLLHHLLGGTRR